jgi:hypothetical protein
MGWRDYSYQRDSISATVHSTSVLFKHDTPIPKLDIARLPAIYKEQYRVFAYNVGKNSLYLS